jgi:hypothetical protein
MGQSFGLGRISGIRIGVNWSVLVIVALLAYGLAAGQLFGNKELRRTAAGCTWPPAVREVSELGRRARS